MIEKPSIADEGIITALDENYPIRVIDIEFLPLGLDSTAWAYRVETESDAYFLKLRKGIPNPAGTLVPRYLREQGIQQAVAPLSTKDGEAQASADDFFFLLYPFVTGERVIDVGMSDAHWVEFGSILKKLHTIKLPAELSRLIRRESFHPKRLAFCKDLHAQVKTRTYNDTFQKELAAYWLEQYETISILLEGAETLATRMQETNQGFVLCHADIHTANLLLSENDKIYIVDWDETMLAPKERDLLFVIRSIFNDTSNGRWEQLFFEGYGDTEIDPLALAYYRYDWCVEDLGEFTQDVFGDGNAGEVTKSNAISWVKYLFAPGHSVELALGTTLDVEVRKRSWL